MSDSSSSGESGAIVNARTTRSFIAIMAYAAILALWAEFLLSIPRYGILSVDNGPSSVLFDLAVWPFLFAAIGLFILRMTTEWTVSNGELRRRGWLSLPGSRPGLAATLGADAELIHEARTRWRLWPEGLAIYCWPGQTARLVSAMNDAGARVDDFRGEWERSHRRLSRLAILSYAAGLAVLGTTPVLGIAAGSGLPLLPVVGGVALLGVGQAIDSQPWKASRPAGSTGYLHK